jgi:hypothetical protein
MTRGLRTGGMDLGRMVVLCLFVLFSLAAWGRVFLAYSNSPLPPANLLGVSDVVFSWMSRVPASLLASARKQGYRVYVEAPLQQATAAAKEGAKAGWTGVILDIPESQRTETQTAVSGLRSAYPKLQFLVLDTTGKQPQMAGSLVIKRDSVLEVSSPTMQPWIDTNLAAIKVEQRKHRPQVPLYTFSWVSDEGQQRTLTVSDYSLAVAEAGAFHANLVLQLDEHLQKALTNNDAEAWALWSQVRSMVKFYSDRSEGALQPAANVAVVVDHLDPSDEVLNLLARHNIPFQILLPADLNAVDLDGFNVVLVFAKPDRVASEHIANLATRGKTVVLVEARGSYPWQSSQPIQVNEHTVSYSLGSGKILELSAPITDPEAFAQDIRRLLGKRDALLSLWNGLTTIAVAYKGGGTLKAIEFVNYATDPIRVQVQVKGSFTSIGYETPERGCCQSLLPVRHDAFTEFVIPELRIAGRVHLDTQ